ncbi:hypothetical protein WJX73_003935 [Symbiochloris irregularis]|uniref:Amino acid transporter n=1 Tax=Symbiochloris irregularis TaxID=706552 RepID=A0AAW1P2H7_9CHLO
MRWEMFKLSQWTERWDSEEVALRRLNIQQQTERDLTVLASFALTLSVIAVGNSVLGNLNACWDYGGPVACIWSYVVVCFFTTFIGLSHAEIVSGLPAAGGPFFWASWFAGRHGPLAGWVTGYLNVLGSVGVTASVAQDAIQAVALIGFLLRGVDLSGPERYGIYMGMLVLSGLLNHMSTRSLARLAALSLLLVLIMVIATLLLVPAVAPWHQSASFVFGRFRGWKDSSSGITDNTYLILQSSLMTMYIMTGFDAPAHLSEEIIGARSAAPVAIITALGASYVLGLLLIIALLFCIQDPAGLMDGTADGAAGYQIIFDAFMTRFGSQTWGIIYLIAPICSSVMCMVLCLATNARVAWAFARDKGLPCSAYFGKVSRSTKTPRRAVWLSVGIALIMGLPMADSQDAFNNGVLSVVTVVLQISYGIPIAFKLTIGRQNFKPGPFSLGRYSLACNGIAVFWVVVSSAALLTPNLYPITGARHWFTGHRHKPREFRLQRLQQLRYKDREKIQHGSQNCFIPPGSRYPAMALEIERSGAR